MELWFRMDPEAQRLFPRRETESTIGALEMNYQCYLRVPVYEHYITNVAQKLIQIIQATIVPPIIFLLVLHTYHILPMRVLKMGNIFNKSTRRET